MRSCKIFRLFRRWYCFERAIFNDARYNCKLYWRVESTESVLRRSIPKNFFYINKCNGKIKLLQSTRVQQLYTHLTNILWIVLMVNWNSTSSVTFWLRPVRPKSKAANLLYRTKNVFTLFISIFYWPWIKNCLGFGYIIFVNIYS
jgi:hypothetical protein